MQTKLHTLLVGAACALLPVSAFAQIDFLTGVTLPRGGEIISFYGASSTLLVTDSYSNAAGYHRIQPYTLGSNGALTAGTAISLNIAETFGTLATNTLSLSSVLADNQGRDFGVASLIPATNGTTLGKVAFFQISTGNFITALEVGYHPDSVTITPDGTKLIVTNEAEYVASENSTTAAPGSVTVIDISSVGSGASGISSLSGSNVTTIDFSSGNLVGAASIAGLRINTTGVAAGDKFRYIEPEYTTASNSKAYVTLQENNAIATIDLTGPNANKVTAIHDLGTNTQTIDASDRDGAGSGSSAVNRVRAIDDVVVGLPEPDTITKFERNGTTYLVTANEGDARPDDADVTAFASANIDPTVLAALDANPLYSGLPLKSKDENALGRLKLLNNVGDTDNDGDIDVPTMLGSRSFSIFNASTGELVADSGSSLEQYVLTNNPGVFNTNNGTAADFDTRSDDKGPEPEALAFGTVNGRNLVFVGNERENGIFAFDITDINLTDVNFDDISTANVIGYYNPITGTADDASGAALVSPESMLFLAAGDVNNPTGKNILIVGFEGTGTNGSIGVFEVSAIPEPSTAAALAGFGALGLAALRRRRSSR